MASWKAKDTSPVAPNNQNNNNNNNNNTNNNNTHPKGKKEKNKEVVPIGNERFDNRNILSETEGMFRILIKRGIIFL